jgi:hypothetical protein
VTQRKTKKIKLLLTVLLVGYVLLEMGSYARMHRSDGRGRRIVEELKEAIALRPLSADGKPTVLLVGNSLIREGLDMDAARAQMGSRYDVHRMIVESTEYPDWRYALPSLFERGARPSYVVLTISPLQMNSHMPLFLETTHYLLTPREVIAMSRAEDGGPSSYAMHFLEYASPYWGTRTSAQTALKDKIPGYRSLLYAWAANKIGPQNFEAKRMQELAEICRRYHVRLVYVALPANNPNGGHDARQIQNAAEVNGVLYLRPIADSDLHGDEYTDFIHLSEAGKAKFMPAFISALTKTLDAAGK